MRAAVRSSPAAVAITGRSTVTPPNLARSVVSVCGLAHGDRRLRQLARRVAARWQLVNELAERECVSALRVRQRTRTHAEPGPPNRLTERNNRDRCPTASERT
ncbi:hypothetical protein MPRG_22610 [Mycobacterium paragordonae]|uniref:Uncharacterized protein n=1 Tax=Mycobacterium paragordonae TaxID=1389713 RepID=A0ABQ1C3F0_9MYCO|nr:hypothetical protein MPRG_22610 [Mycobacterium paragordonae]